jgi:predicted transcriptional regulator
MPPGSDDSQFSRRERQIMEVVYARGESSAREILAEIPDPPGYSSVRKLLGILVAKGHIKQRSEGKRLLYTATKARSKASRGAMQRLVDVFFSGSVEEAVSGMISLKRDELTDEQLERLASVIEGAQKANDNKGKKK